LDAQKREKKTTKMAPVLLIGTAGSGKSTFGKQMQLIHKTQLDNNAYKSILLSNIVVGIQERIALMSKLELQLEGEYLKHKRAICEANAWDVVWNESFSNSVSKMWDSPVFQSVNANSTEHQLQITNMPYLMENMTNYLNEEYVPTNEDLLKARQRTTGANEISFMREKNAWTLIDLGGQFCEREKWIKYLGELQDVDDVTAKSPLAFIAFIALDEFDVASNEDTTKTKFVLSMEVIKKFAQIKEAEFLVPIIFLNKVDLFKEKLGKEEGMTAFKKHFPTFEKDTTEDAIKFMEEFVFNDMQSLGKDAEIPVLTTCALDGALMDNVFGQIQGFLLQRSLFRAGVVF